MKIRHLLLIGFALSNMSALIYQVVWARELTYIFGTSVYAISTVLTCFMAGLAIGSFWIGRVSDKSKNLFKLFALLELGIGAYGVAIIGIFELLPYPYFFLHSLFHESFFLFNFSQFILCFIALILPTTFIGATFPVMSKLYTEKFNELGENIGIVYSSDTIGAAVGAFSSGFILIPIIGLTNAMVFAALINLLVGAVIYNFSNKTIPIKETKRKRIRLRPTDKIILFCFFFSGFAALMYEVVWTRFLSLIFGTSTYAFSTMLTAFMAGLALGSYAMSKIVDRVKDPVGTFIFVELGIGLYGILLLLLFSNLDMLYFSVYSKWNAFSTIWLAFFLVFFSLLLIPTTLMGATMPLVSKIYSHAHQTVGGDIGKVYSSNTFGGIFGAFMAGFVLIPLIGIEKSSIMAAAINIGVAIALFKFSKIKKTVFFSIIGIFFVLGTSFSTYSIDPLQAGIYYHAPRYLNVSNYEQAKAGTTLLFKKDDPHGLVTVTKRGDDVALKINGKTDATNFGDIPNEYMLAFIPLLTHEEPRSVLNVGLGAGFTLSAIEDFDVDEIDVIEINPAVVEATEQYFSEYNDNALEDPRANLIIADARNYLFTSDKRYDVIISVPSNPWLAGEGGLFTKEYYEIIKEHLNEGGIFCQWTGMYEHTTKDFKTFLNTFHSVFPYVQIYMVGGNVILLGSEESIYLDYPSLVERFDSGRIKEHFAMLRYVRYVDFGITDEKLPDVEYFLSFYLMDSREVSDYIRGTEEINTDDMPLIEFETARTHMLKGGVPVEERPDVDMVRFKIRRYGTFLRDLPLRNTVNATDSKHVIDLVMVSVEDIDDWRLEEVGYGFSYIDMAQFDILRSVRYDTPMGSLVLHVADNVHGELEEKQIREFMAYYWKLGNLKKVREMKIEEHDAYLFTDDEQIFGAWYCEENAAVYLLILPYTEDIEGAKDIFRHVKCLH